MTEPEPEQPVPPYKVRRDLRVSQAAHRLDVSERTVRRWILSGKLPGAYRPGGEWRIPAEDVEALLGRTVEPVEA